MPSKSMMPGHKSSAMVAAKPAKKPVAKKMAVSTPDTVCMSCMPMGETQIIAMLLVAVLGLASVLTVSVLSLEEQREALGEQALVIEGMKLTN